MNLKEQLKLYHTMSYVNNIFWFSVWCMKGNQELMNILLVNSITLPFGYY